MNASAPVFAIYSRKSKFTGKGESIGNQVELCREHIRARYGDGAADNAAVFEDEGFSGGNLNRPGYRRMMKAAHEGRFRAIVVYRLDRISRNIGDFSALIEELSRLDVDFVSIRERFDTGSPMGRAMMYISSVFSQLERETIAERIRDNMRELAKTGRWLGGVTPTGYASESVGSVSADGRTRRMCRLKLAPEEAEIVREIYRLFAERDSLTAVETELLRRQRVTKTGKNFTRFSIKNILQNPVYLTADADAYRYFADRRAEIFSELSAFDGLRGILAYNRTDQKKGRAAIALPVNEWIITVGEHPGIIPAKMWIQTQEALERNKSKAYRKPRSNEALLTGLLFCRCGSRMYPKLTKRVTPDGKAVYAYVCKMKERSQRSRCNLRNANGNALDEGVMEELKKLSGDDSRFIERLEKSERFYAGSRGQYDATLEDLRREQAENEKKIAGLVDSLAELGDGASRKRVAARIEELSRAGETLRVRIGELEGLTGRQAFGDMEFALMRRLLTAFRDSIDAMSVEEKRAAARTLILKVVWDGEFARVILFGASEDGTARPDLKPLISAATDARERGESDAETPLREDSEDMS